MKRRKLRLTKESLRLLSLTAVRGGVEPGVVPLTAAPYFCGLTPVGGCGPDRPNLGSNTRCIHLCEPTLGPDCTHRFC